MQSPPHKSQYMMYILIIDIIMQFNYIYINHFDRPTSCMHTYMYIIMEYIIYNVYNYESMSAVFITNIIAIYLCNNSHAFDELY